MPLMPLSASLLPIVALIFWSVAVEAKAKLWGHFYIHGCREFPSKVTSEIDLQQLTKNRSNFYLQLEIYGKYTPQLMANGTPPCQLPSSDLYRLDIKTDKRTLEASLNFRFVTDGLNMTRTPDEVTKRTTVCRLAVSHPLKIIAGYAFLSCENDLRAVRSSVEVWKGKVKEEEKSAHGKKMTIMGAVAGGAALFLTSCIVCIVLRMRATKGRPPRSARAGTPARSVQTRVAHEPSSGTQQSILSSGISK